MTFNERLKEQRQKQKLSQRALAEIAGLSDAHISMLETTCRENPSYFAIKKLAQALECKINDLIGETDPTETAI